MKAKMLFLVSLICSGAFAQEKYRIVYDYNTDATSYYKIDKNNQVADTLSKPKFKRNSLVEIQLKNINPFAVEVVADVKEDKIHQSGGGFNFGALLSGFGGMTGGALRINPQNLPEDGQVFSRGKSRGTDDLTKLNEIVTSVDAIKKSLRADMANPNMDKEKIIQNLKNIASKIDKEIGGVKLADPNDNFHHFLSTLDALMQEYKLKLNGEIDQMFKEVEEYSAGSETLSRGTLNNQNTLFRTLQATKDAIESSASQTTTNIDDISNFYGALESSDFDITYDYIMESDKTDIQLKFLSTDFYSYDADGNQKNLKTRNLKLFSKGGFKVNTSVALTLTNFGANSNEYYIDREGIIQAEKNDHFVPSLGVMVNFYPMLSENFNIGGSFGLAIPISDDIKGINFLLGPSIYFGNENRLSITGGIAFGPVNKLTTGLKVGDEAEVYSLDNYTKTVYDFGYFFGVSFSIFDVN